MSIPTWMGKPVQWWIDCQHAAGLERYGWPTGEPTICNEFDSLDITPADGPWWGRLEPCWNSAGGQNWKPMDAGHIVFYGQGLESVVDSVLTLKAERYTGGRMAASMVCTPERLFGHGYYEMKAKLCGTGGAKLCWWMYADPAVAEIDMAEQRMDCSPWAITGSLHTLNYTSGITLERPIYTLPVSCWHYYGFVFGRYELRWFVDGVPYGSCILPSYVKPPMHMLISLEMPSPWSTGGQAEIEYVRYWEA